MNGAVSGTPQLIPLSRLRLDWENPRLPSEMQSPDKSQRELALYINKHYDPLRIADSISRHEYFQSEPLIAVEEDAGYRVIEGNRRLTALMGLADGELRAVFAEENKGWNRIPDPTYPDLIPVVVVGSAQSVAPLLGYRHISGIEPWDPFAQARYVARLVERDGLSLDEVAELVGRRPTEVRSMYRDYDILQQAQSMFGLDTTGARNAFGVFTNALGRRAVQTYIGAPPPRGVDPGEHPLPADRGAQLENLLRWIFGGKRGEGRVISDSRQLTELARVLGNTTATAVLESSGDLGDAFDAMSDPEEQFHRSSSIIRRELRKVRTLAKTQVSKSAVQEFVTVVSGALTEIAELGSGPQE